MDKNTQNNNQQTNEIDELMNEGFPKDEKNTIDASVIEEEKKKARKKMILGGIIIGVSIIGFGLFNFIWTTIQDSQKISITQVLNDIKADKVKEIESCNSNLILTYKDDTKKTAIASNGSLEYFLFSKDGLGLDSSKIIIKNCVKSIDASEVFSILIQVLMLVGLGLIAWKLLKSVNDSGSKIFGFGESKAKMFLGKKQDVRFNDVAGVDEAMEELNEIVMFLKDPERFQKMGARIPKGVLMVGQPGTGKTLLARAIAGEAEVPFFATSGSEFEEMLVGAGASRVRDLFAKAKKVSPALIFIDEIDAVAKKRGTSLHSNATEQTLNQILVEMDGFEKSTNVIVIAATNRPDVLDPALLRPGRFDRKITIDLPDQDGRLAILQVHSKNKPLSTGVNLTKIAKRTIGFSGADLENVLNEAAIIATKAEKSEISEKDLEEATLKVVMGTARKRRRTTKELETVAFHEAGHAVVTKFVPEADPVHKITIVSRGMSGGMTMHMPEEDESLTTKTKMLSEIKVLLAGQIAEKLFMGDITTGASNDIERATKLARDIVKKFGMTTELGMVRYTIDEEVEGFTQTHNYSQNTAYKIDELVKSIIDNCYKETENIISLHKDKMLKLKQMLMENEVVNAEEFNSIF